LATGGSFAVRQSIRTTRRCCLKRRARLAGRISATGPLTLASIGEAQRRPESELWREFEITRPRILGALLDAVVYGLRALGRVHLDRLPRMADFALWAAALWPAGTFAHAPMRQTAGLRSRASSMPTRSPLARVKSWRAQLMGGQCR